LAGEIAQEVAVALALSSAAIGAGGSVLSQIVGGVIVSRREKKKAEADERRWHIEADAKRRDRSLDHKIELFSRFLAALEGIQRAEAWGSPVSHQDFMAHNQTLDEAQQVLEEIGLIAPDVYRHANATHRSVTTNALHESTRWLSDRSSGICNGSQERRGDAAILDGTNPRGYQVIHQPRACRMARAGTC
jgi:hypothetical protein